MKTALITGASSGIGLEFAKLLAKEKYNLVLVARSVDKLNALKFELMDKYNVEITIIPQDLSQSTAPEVIFHQLQADNHSIDLLINNAGLGGFGFFSETSWQSDQEMINVNITALTHLTKLFLPQMMARKQGCIINVASTAAFQPGPLMAVYYATKAYVLFFSEAIANEVSESGVKVMALCPGPTQSGFQKVADMEDSGLVKNFNMPTSAEVAKYGYQAMLKGKRVAVHGILNKILVASVRFSPRRTITWVIRKLSEKK